MRELFDFPNEILFAIVRYCSMEMLSSLARTSTQGRNLVNDEAFWQRRISQDLTKSPTLRPGQLFKNFYEVAYDFKQRDYSTHRPLLDDNNYKSYLTRLIVDGHLSDEVLDHSLDAYLVSACIMGLEVWAEELLNKGANVNLVYCSQSPLMLAAGRGHAHMIRLLVTKGGDINYFPQSEYDRSLTLFHAALIAPGPEAFLAAVNISNALKKPIKVLPPLYKMVICNDQEKLIERLKQCPNLERFDLGGLTILGWSIILNRLEIFKALRSAGASLKNVASYEHVSELGYSFFGSAHALSLAVQWRRTAILSLLLSSGLRLDSFRCGFRGSYFHPKSRSLLELATELNYAEGVSILLQYPGCDGKEASVVLAASLGYFEVLKILLSALDHAAIRSISQDEEPKSLRVAEETPIGVAAKNGHTRCIGLLLKCGANPNAISIHTNTHFPRGSDASHPLSFVETKSFSPLMNAIKHLLSLRLLDENTVRLAKTIASSTGPGFFKDVEYLIRKERDNFLRVREFGVESYSVTKKSSVLSRQALANIDWLLKAGADVNYVDQGGETALDLLIRALHKSDNHFTQNHTKLIWNALALLLMEGAVLKNEQLFTLLRAGVVSLRTIKFLDKVSAVDWLGTDTEGRSLICVVKEMCKEDVVEYVLAKSEEATQIKLS